MLSCLLWVSGRYLKMWKIKQGHSFSGWNSNLYFRQKHTQHTMNWSRAIQGVSENIKIYVTVYLKVKSLVEHTRQLQSWARGCGVRLLVLGSSCKERKRLELANHKGPPGTLTFHPEKLFQQVGHLLEFAFQIPGLLESFPANAVLLQLWHNTIGHDLVLCADVTQDSG